MSDDTIKNINKTIVHEDGKIDSFDKQLINLSGGIYKLFELYIDNQRIETSYYDGFYCYKNQREA